MPPVAPARSTLHCGPQTAASWRHAATHPLHAAATPHDAAPAQAQTTGGSIEGREGGLALSRSRRRCRGHGVGGQAAAAVCTRPPTGEGGRLVVAWAAAAPIDVILRAAAGVL